MTDVAYATVVAAQHAVQRMPELTRLYAVVYAQPPYEEGPEQARRFADSFADEVRRPGFTLVEARAGGTLVGAAYGWTMPAGRWFANAAEPPPADIEQSQKFALMEWMVHPGWRGGGIGRHLIRSILADRTEQWAVLASDPRSAARAMYDRAGWRRVGRSTLSWGAAMDLLALSVAPAG